MHFIRTRKGRSIVQNSQVGSCVPRICTVFYSIGETYRSGFGHVRFPRKVLGKIGWKWCMWVGGSGQGGGECVAWVSAALLLREHTKPKKLE